MLRLKWPDKDPNEVLDFELDWSLRLDGDEVVSSTWSVTTGSVTIVDGAYSFSTTVTKVWLEGGTDGEPCEVQNRITTLGGRTMDQSVRLKIKTK